MVDGRPKGGASSRDPSVPSFLNSGLDPATADPSTLRKVRAVTLANLGLIAVAIPFVIQYWRIELPGMAAAVGGTALFGVALLVALRRTQAPDLVGGFALAGLFVLLLLSNVTSGGFYDPNFAWFYVLPIAAATITTRRQAFAWTLVVVVTTLVFWWLHETGQGPTSLVPPEERSLQSLFNRLSAVVCIALMIALFHHWQTQAEHAVRDAAEQIRMQEREMRRLALFDPLTGLPSRAFLERKIAYLVKTNEPFAVIFADLDRFKAINDTMGHPAGDDLLVAVGQRFEMVVGTPSQTSFPDLDDYWAAPHPVVARRGGDELIVVLPGADVGDAREVASRIIDSLSTPFPLGDRQLHVSVSMGVAVAPRHGNDAASLMRAADVALYEAKRRVGSSAAVYEAAMTQSTPRSLLVEEALRLALETDELRLVYQPLFGQDGVPRGAEALLRWQCQALGEVAPTELIPIAEATGLIVPIGRRVLAHACTEAKRWALPLRIAVNVSPVQLRDPVFVDHVREALERSQLAPARLELEITESVLLDDDDGVAKCLNDLRDLGVSLTVDDFGTGYSNLSYLRRLPVSRLKIDRAFVSRMDRDRADAALVSAIVAMGHGLGLEVVAEGVETDEQASMLAEMECHEMQGFHLQEPLEVEAFRVFARRTSDIVVAG